MVLKVNGVDMIPYLAKNGIKYKRSDLDGPNAGRLANGEMQRDKVATKVRWDLSCKPLYGEDVSRILTAIAPEYVTVQYTDPQTQQVKTGKFYSNNIPVTIYGTLDNGKELWSGLEFPLIEK